MGIIRFKDGDSPIFEGYECGYQQIGYSRQNWGNGFWLVPLVDEANYTRILLWLTTETNAMMLKERTTDELFIGHSLDTLMSMPDGEWREVIRDYECEGMILNWFEIATAPYVFSRDIGIDDNSERLYNVGAHIAWEQVEEGND